MSNHNSLNISPGVTTYEHARMAKHQALKRPTMAQAMQIAKFFQVGQQNVGAAAKLSNYSLPAGYTYLGQFITHDIGVVRNLGLPQPTLSLLSLYGFGPSAMPYLYVHYESDLYGAAMDCAYLSSKSEEYDSFRGAKMRLLHEGKDQYDVPRVKDERALMADDRNDQNFLVNQVHCAFIRFHNALAEWLQYVSRTYAAFKNNGTPELKGEQLFLLTRRLAICYYRRIILEDYLPKLVGDKLVNDLLANQSNFKLFDPTKQPLLMPEFRLAGMRLHPQVREVYMMNSKGRREVIFGRQSRPNAPVADLGGFKDHRYLEFEWEMFFDTKGGQTAQPSAAINHQIAFPLSALRFRPSNNQNLSKINVSQADELPCGLELAKAIGIPLLTQTELDTIFDGHTNVPKVAELPLWPYVMLEAAAKKGGQALGELGGRIVAEQIIWVLNQEHSQCNAGSTSDLAANVIEEYPELDVALPEASVLKQALDDVGFGKETLSMVDLLNFPDKVKSKIGSLRIEMEGKSEKAERESLFPKMDLLDVIRDATKKK